MKAITVTLPSGEIAYLEVEEEKVETVTPVLPPGGGTTASIREKVVTLQNELAKVNEVIVQVCASVRAKLIDGLKDAIPNEVTLEFGIKLAGEGGVPLLTKGSIEAAFKVNAKWNFEKPK